MKTGNPSQLRAEKNAPCHKLDFKSTPLKGQNLKYSFMFKTEIIAENLNLVPVCLSFKKNLLKNITDV